MPRADGTKYSGGLRLYHQVCMPSVLAHSKAGPFRHQSGLPVGKTELSTPLKEALTLSAPFPFSFRRQKKDCSKTPSAVYSKLVYVNFSRNYFDMETPTSTPLSILLCLALQEIWPFASRPSGSLCCRSSQGVLTSIRMSRRLVFNTLFSPLSLL